MTKLETGDKGQRYEVRAKNKSDGTERVIGWAENPDNLVKAVKLHPVYNIPNVIDRREIQDGD
ncbi:MAG: hypothetical protein V3U75_04160 [Methylococcaceae bacterium]